MSALRKTVLSKGSKRFTTGSNDFTPVKWSHYFEDETEISTTNGTFHVLTKGNSGPILLCLHGGGYSALTWALFAEEIVEKIECRVFAIDLRGHGKTISIDDKDLSLETLSEDVCKVIETMFPLDVPPIILVGHSMGGAVAVETARNLLSVVALCVIDVVEGTALESLSSMQSVLRGRPTTFRSIESAIQWSFRSQTHNLDAARVSMPGQIKNLSTGELAACESAEEQKVASSDDSSDSSSLAVMDNIIIEETDEQLSAGVGSSYKPPLPPLPSNPSDKVGNKNLNLYGWRIDLSRTESFWCGWFRGLSQKFLDITVPKVLLLANIHGLDTLLTVGQMQGKFQLQVLPRSGHAIHEDQPHQVADIIAGFLVKQKLTTAKNHFTPSMPAC